MPFGLRAPGGCPKSIGRETIFCACARKIGGVRLIMWGGPEIEECLGCACFTGGVFYGISSTGVRDSK